MKNYQIIDDQKISEKLLAPLEDVRKYMRNLAKKKNKGEWIVVCINNRCIFYNFDLIMQFIKLYNEGLNEKSIFNTLSQEFPIRSRAEIKAIEERLLHQERIEERDPLKMKLLPYESKIVEN